ncbi:MAG: hypothetical protein OXC62_09470 [Aestuariivita sp.]|nr:hypothetical protein [Aestuariivita sp.]
MEEKEGFSVVKTFNVLMIKDHLHEVNLAWCAQCLEHDVVGQGDTIEKAMISLMKTLIAEDAYRRSLNGSLEDIPKSPKEYWDMFENASKLDIETAKLGMEIKLEPERTVSSTPEYSIPAPFIVPKFQEARVV